MKLQYILLLSALCTLALTESAVKTAIDAGENISGKISADVAKKTITLAAKPKVVVLPNCGLGQHNYNAKCESNNGNSCKKFDKNTGSCAECKWFAWMVKNDTAHQNKKMVGTGNWCETRWWLWLIIGVSSLMLLCMVAGVITYCCCGKSKKKEVVEERAPLNQPREVEVQHVAPTYQREIVVESRPAHQHYHNTVYTSAQPQTRYVSGGHTHSYVSGDRHAGEARVYSPQRVETDSRVIRHTDAEYHRNTNSHKYYAN